MKADEVRAVVLELARVELGGVEELPAGELAEHLDSVQRLALAVAVEDRFEVCLDPEDEEGIRTLDDLVACVATKLDAAGA